MANFAIVICSPTDTKTSCSLLFGFVVISFSSSINLFVFFPCGAYCYTNL